MSIQVIDLMMANAIAQNGTEYSIVVDLSIYDTNNWKFGLRATHAGTSSTRTVTIQNANQNVDANFTNGAALETTAAVGTAYTDISTNVKPSQFIRFSVLASSGNITSIDLQLAIG